MQFRSAANLPILNECVECCSPIPVGSRLWLFWAASCITKVDEADTGASPTGPRLCMQGDTALSRAVYRDFLAVWKDADPDIPIGCWNERVRFARVIQSQPVARAHVLFVADGRTSFGSHLVEIRMAPFQ